MAKETQVVVYDDLTGEVALDAKTRQLTVDGTRYDLDLSDESYLHLLDVLQPFIGHLKPVNKQTRVTRSPARVDRAQTQAKRKFWYDAYASGVQLDGGVHLPTPNARGRIPQTVEALYDTLGGVLPATKTSRPKKKAAAKK